MSVFIDLFFHKEAFATWELIGWWFCGVAVGIKWVQYDNKKLAELEATEKEK